MLTFNVISIFSGFTLIVCDSPNVRSAYALGAALFSSISTILFPLLSNKVSPCFILSASQGHSEYNFKVSFLVFIFFIFKLSPMLKITPLIVPEGKLSSIGKPGVTALFLNSNCLVLGLILARSFTSKKNLTGKEVAKIIDAQSFNSAG